MYDSAPPPAPKLHSKGVMAMDITQQFTAAAERECSSHDTRHAVY